MITVVSVNKKEVNVPYYIKEQDAHCLMNLGESVEEENFYKLFGVVYEIFYNRRFENLSIFEPQYMSKEG
ncbi:MAG: hypothetical protein LBH98_00450 [Chitinispirillales bacterium]|jgi:hypothetical protein|nr:hypothetical protein [Chitinispirillales bacterium]